MANGKISFNFIGDDAKLLFKVKKEAEKRLGIPLTAKQLLRLALVAYREGQ